MTRTKREKWLQKERRGTSMSWRRPGFIVRLEKIWDPKKEESEKKASRMNEKKEETIRIQSQERKKRESQGLKPKKDKPFLRSSRFNFSLTFPPFLASVTVALAGSSFRTGWPLGTETLSEWSWDQIKVFWRTADSIRGWDGLPERSVGGSDREKKGKEVERKVEERKKWVSIEGKESQREKGHETRAWTRGLIRPIHRVSFLFLQIGDFEILDSQRIALLICSARATLLVWSKYFLTGLFSKSV